MPKLKLDENLPASLQGRLVALGFDVDTARQEGLNGKPDSSVLSAAAAEGRIIVTQDLDFADLRRADVAASAGVIIVRLADPESSRLIERIVRALQSEHVHEWPERLVVITDDRVRTRSLR